MTRVTATLMSHKHSRLTDNLARAWGVMYQRKSRPAFKEGVLHMRGIREINTPIASLPFTVTWCCEVGSVFWKTILTNSDHHTSLTEVIVSTGGQDNTNPAYLDPRGPSATATQSAAACTSDTT